VFQQYVIGIKLVDKANGYLREKEVPFRGHSTDVGSPLLV